MGDPAHQPFLVVSIIIVSGVMVLIVVAAIVMMVTSSGKKKKRRADRRDRMAAPAPSAPTTSARTTPPRERREPPARASSRSSRPQRDEYGRDERYRATLSTPSKRLDETEYDLEADLGRSSKRKLDETDYDLAGDSDLGASLDDSGGLSESKFGTAMGLSDSSLVPDGQSSTMMGATLDESHTDITPAKRNSSRSTNDNRSRKPRISRGGSAMNPSAKKDKTTPPIEQDGPGSYCVQGVDKKTGMDTELILYAQSKSNARIKGQLKGIIVTDVNRISD